MKKIGIVLLIVTMFFVVGCNKDQLDQMDGGGVVVEVTDKTGNKIAGAEVRLEGLAKKETDDEGVVVFSGVEQEKYSLKVSKNNFPVEEKTISVNDKRTMINIELQGVNRKVDETMIVDADEYIDINDQQVKFLFKTNNGNRVKFHLGTEKNDLKQLKTKKYYNDGLIIEDLKPNESYYYKIEVIDQQNNTSKETEVLSFDKLDNTNDWEPAKWAKDAVFYEVFVRSFYDGSGDGIGDFAGLKEKIPYFKELGIDALWLMPINDSPTYHGYDVVDYYETNSDYGTRKEFREFLEAAHENDLKVIMDLVVNHTADDHKWFQEARKSEENEYTDYYIWRDEFDNIDEKGPWGQQVWHKFFTPDYYYAVFWDQMPDLNFRNPDVRQEMKKRAKFWLDPNGDGDFSDGVDGFRLDAALHIDDKDPQVTHNWWQEFNTAVKEVNPDAFLVGENWTDTKKMAKFYDDLDASFNFSLADKIIDFASEGQASDTDILAEIKEIHQVYSNYSEEYIDATFLRNHDQDRVASELNGNKGQMKLAASVLFTLPGTPFVYYGEELGQKGTKPDDNIREPFDWYQEAEGEGMTTMSKGGFYHQMKYTKEDDGISLEEQQNQAGSIFEHYQKLIKIRKNNPLLFDGEYTKIKTNEQTYGYKVSSSEADYNLFVIHNQSGQDSQVKTSDQVQGLLTEETYQAGQVKIDAYGTLILKSTREQL
ncbi:MAG: alpha-amylase family glycosyl hydrolase [Bacillota bacterium]